MTNSYIVDTNVLLVANELNDDANVREISVCIKFLKETREKRISIDDKNLIFKEYFQHVNRSGQPGVGDAFAKWLWDNQAVQDKVEKVTITPLVNDPQNFIEFPQTEELQQFDPSDRKFVAVAVGSRFEAIICNATDSDWVEFIEELKEFEIQIKFLCPRLVGLND